MFSTGVITHEKKNQTNYATKAKEHDSLTLNSTLYLAYRDIGDLLKRHLYPRLTNSKIRLLDFGCGVGLSTEIISSRIMTHLNLTVEVLGVDISEENLKIAKEKLPQANFKCITEESKLDDIGQFELIICNFVLVEMNNDDMLKVLNLLQSKLSENGIIIVTNPTGRAYRPENKWCTFNNQFVENVPTKKLKNQEKKKYHEDQPIKVQILAAEGSTEGFTFFDYYHSGAAYRGAYSAANLKLLETHKPIGKLDDKIEWKSEAEKPPYKIHVLRR